MATLVIFLTSLILTLFAISIFNEIKKIQSEDGYEAQKNEFKNKIKKGFFE